VSLGFGKGRMNYVTDAVQAMFILQDLQSQSPTIYSAEQVEAIAQGVTLIRNNRYLDYRIRYKTQLRMLDSVLQENGVKPTNVIDYFTTISDNWLYGNRISRMSGRSWSHSVTVGNRFEYTTSNSEQNLLAAPKYQFDKQKVIRPDLNFNTNYTYSHQSSLYVQNQYSISASTGLCYMIRDNIFGYDTLPLVENALYNFYGESVQWISSLGGNYQYLYQANTRNSFIINVWPSMQFSKYLPKYMTPSKEELKENNIEPNLNLDASYYHWFSPQLSISMSGSVGTASEYGRTQTEFNYVNRQYTYLNYRFYAGLIYRFF
jgi:hypothetical protein